VHASPRRSSAAIWLSCLFIFSLAANAVAFQETPPEQQAAIKAIGGWASNVQKNRDGTVRFIRFSKTLVKDKHVAPVAKFAQLDYLAIVSPGVTDAGIAHAAGLTNLDTLFLSHSQLSDQGMPSLANLPKLERLYLDGTRITDAGTKHLAGLTTLTTLSLADTAIGDATLKVVSQLQNLEVLILSGTSVTDAGLAEIAKLPNLRVLDVSRTGLTGEGLRQLEANAKLESLDLDAAPISVTLPEQLSSIKSLKLLSLRRTNIARKAAAQIRDSHPQLEVRLSPESGHELSALERFLQKPRRKPGGPSGNDGSTQPEENLQDILAPADTRFLATDEVPDFQRHIIPLLGRLGCNGRACHGSFQGKGGFRLSMFGYDFDEDLKALTAGEFPRVDRKDPEQSLIILKPTQQEEHEGGLRFKKDSWEHKLIRRWIEAGAKGVEKERPHFVRLDVTPREVVFKKAGETAQLEVVAVWSDGSREDVTTLTRFQTNNDTVADVDENGLIMCVGPGDSYVISFYDNGIFSTQAILPVSDQTGESYPDVPTPTRIDELVVAKLSKLGIVPSELSSDAEFLRRVSLDIAGTLPTPEQLLEFVADASPDKRSRKIDELLNHPAHIEWWTNLICDLTGANSQFLGSTDMNSPAAIQWRQWVHRRVEQNVGWDRIVAGLLLARSRRPGQTYMDYAAEQSSNMRRRTPEDFSALDNPMHYYWFRSNITSNTDRALSFGYVFLGVRLDCAQCHKHPFDQWSKQDFTEFTEFFSRVKAGAAPESREVQNALKAKLGVPKKLDTAALRRQMYMRVAAEGKPIPWNEIYIDPPRKTPHIARILGGPQLDLNDYDDPREALMEWLVSEKNPYFARAIVNRLWAHYFNVGIVNPPDDFNMANPPSNKALLDFLAAEFVAHGYDMKWLHREITNSRTYQLSWQPNETNRKDERNFSHAVLRRLPAEATIDAILQATAGDAKMKLLNSQTTGRKIAQHPKSIQARGIDYSLLVFGKPLRTTNCDCERQTSPTLLQSLYVRNDHELLGWLERPDGWLKQVAKELGEPLLQETGTVSAAKQPELVRKDVEPEKIVALVERAYLRTLTRKPDDAEMARGTKHLDEAPNHVEGLRDLMWALLNTQEFMANH
jgi:hypothetical protein